MELKAEDMFWANLAGNMESIDAGTTTILDHAHMNWSKDHSKCRCLRWDLHILISIPRLVRNSRNDLFGHPLDFRLYSGLHCCQHKAED